MGEYFEIDEEDREYAIGVFDDMLQEFGSPCELIYSSRDASCNNCIINPNTGESTNRYNGDGPVPFDLGEICPVCEGTGRIINSAIKQGIVMVVDWAPKPWMQVGNEIDSSPLRIPGGMITTRGFASDLYKVTTADSLVINNSRFTLYGQPYLIGPITNNRYFIAIWQRAL